MSVGFAAGLLIVLAVLVATVFGTGDDQSADRPALIVLAAAAALAHLLEIRLDEGLIGRDAATERLIDWYATR